MTTYARILNGFAIDVTTVDPSELFHADVAATFVTVPSGTSNGDRQDGNTWVKYVAPEPVPPAPAKPPTITPPQFKLLILGELPEILAAAPTDPMLSAFMDIVNDPRLTEVDLSLQSVQNGLKYCLMKIGRTEQQIAARMTEILTGVWS